MVSVQRSNITDEVLDFLVSAPAPEKIIAFHASDKAQEQLGMLLDRNRNGMLSEQEKAKLEGMNQVDDFFTVMKGRAMKLLKGREAATPRCLISPKHCAAQC